MRSPPAPAVIVTLAALAGACSLTTPLDSFSNGDPIDSGTDPDARTADAPTDATPSDATPPIDGGVDAAVPFRCADHPAAAFCSDFETDPFDFGWEARRDTGGTYALVPARTSRGLEATVFARPGDFQDYAAGLTNTVVMVAGASFTYSFDVLLGPTLATANVINFGGFAFRGGTFYQADLRSTNGSFSLQEFADATGMLPTLSRGSPLVRGPAVGIWTNVEMRWTFTPTASHAVIKLDGKVVLDRDTEAHHYAASPEFLIGITNAQGKGSAFTLVVDDVLVTTP